MTSPDDWQKDLLAATVTREENTICNCSRQSGKTEVNSLAAYIEAANGGFSLVLTPSDEQSKEFMEILTGHHNRLLLTDVVDEPTKHELRFEGGGRVKALPNNERTVRIYRRVTLLVIDEAARVPDALFGAVTPMMAVSQALGLGARTALLSTPFGKRGFFYKEWTEGRGYRKFFVPWQQCPRISKELIERERERHDDLWVAQEYELEFLDVTGLNPFNLAEFDAMVCDDIEVIQSW